MQPQLEALAAEFASAQARLDRLAAVAPEPVWSRRPAADRWSAAECVAHLNLTAEAYVPVVGEALERARVLKAPTPRRYRRDVLGWLLWWTIKPPPRFKAKTTARFVPDADAPREALLAEFGRRQEEQTALVAAAEGLPIDRVKIASLFDRRVKYNLYSAFRILAAHQHRHLWQAEAAVGLTRA